MTRTLDVLCTCFAPPPPHTHFYPVLKKFKKLSKTKVGGGPDPPIPTPWLRHWVQKKSKTIDKNLDRIEIAHQTFLDFDKQLESINEQLKATAKASVEQRKKIYTFTLIKGRLQSLM